MQPRYASVQVLLQVIRHGHSLTDALNEILPRIEAKQRPFVQALCYGVIRWYHRLDFILSQLLKKPLREKDMDVYCLLLAGLYQLIDMRIPDHAAVSETVAVTRKFNKRWAKDLVNAILRSWQREQAHLDGSWQADPEALYSHPAWFIERLQQSRPDSWQAILQANNEQAPMTLRVNTLKTDRETCLAELRQHKITAHPCRHAHQGITLETPCQVESLPGFSRGEISVQDEAAQLAAELLQPQPGERILDACAAPGGKTAHLLEIQPRLGELVALDVDEKRLQRVTDNLSRLGLNAAITCGDAADPTNWWDGRPFDRILLDAPCSASGVIRRHPDIKLLRRPTDIEQLILTQQKILTALWPLLKPGGMLLYATCSVLPDENMHQISRFLDNQADAGLAAMHGKWGHQTGFGRQILPGEEGMDGFFYACLHKTVQ
ncbi:MAG: 16S rRNA (cytosine(967)-C(5))-methyltransferase RsmB [Gammaproteobacteria bacterium]|nr:16S rRNA (cytosine(967)-C(5))-methyltransferase RsmB [Gammaproteobacteria bacterium]MDH5650468.1 16S rRNA (cytosine(967)-C(5))-methyltransferase RsmB [Gammaproteobacteria bacterium]